MQAILEKLLTEDDFLFSFLLTDNRETFVTFELKQDEQDQLHNLKTKIVTFFGGEERFFKSLEQEETRAQIYEYSRERFAYKLASQQHSGKPYEVVWVS